MKHSRIAAVEKFIFSLWIIMWLYLLLYLHVSYEPAIPNTNICFKRHIHKYGVKQILEIIQIVEINKYEQIRCKHIQTNHATINGTELLLCTTEMSLTNIMLSKRIQTQRYVS